MPSLLLNGEKLWAAFEKQIGVFVASYESIKRDGFNPKYPIELVTGDRILPTETGKVVTANLFTGEGNHRLACLRSLGFSKLPSAWFRVKCFKEITPHDMTNMLINCIPIEPGAYFAYLSSGYCSTALIHDIGGLMEYITANRSEYLNEVVSLITIDGYGTE